MNSRLEVRLGLDDDELPPSRAVPVTADSLPSVTFGPERRVRFYEDCKWTANAQLEWRRLKQQRAALGQH